MNIVRMEHGFIDVFRCRHKVYDITFKKERRGTQKREKERDREIETMKERQQEREGVQWIKPENRKK